MNFKGFLRNHRKLAFTLAEVVVVMGILGVMMVAFAPVITKRTTSTTAAFKNFRETVGHNGIYYGAPSDSKTVLIGNNQIAASYSLQPKLMLVNHNTTAGNLVQPQITFAVEDSGTIEPLGQLLFNNIDSLVLGGRKTTAYNTELDHATIIGVDACKEIVNLQEFQNLVCIGANAGPRRGAPAGVSNEDIPTNRIYIGSQDINYTAEDIYFGGKSLPEILSPHIVAAFHSYEGLFDKHFDSYQRYSGNPANLAIYYATQNGKHYWAGRDQDGVNAKTYVDGFLVSADDSFSWDTDASSVSDRRLKNVGELFKGGLEELSKLEFFHYTYKNDDKKIPHVGVMAQDLQQVFPDAVKENPDGFLYIRTEDMFYAGLNAIKELYVKVLDHESRIQKLEEENTELKQELKELQKMYVDLEKRVTKLDNNRASLRAYKKQAKMQAKVEKLTQPVTEPAVQPVTEPAVQPVAEPAVEPVVQE